MVPVRFLASALLPALLVLIPAGTTSPLSGQAAADVEAALSNLAWRDIGPANMGGRVSAIHGVPGDPLTFWVGGADGGVWKTVNGGITFEGQWQDEDAYSVGAIAVAPSDPNVVYVGSGEGDPRNSVSYGLGVWRSTDGGTTWRHVGLERTERIHRIVVDPRDPDVALVCAMGREWGPNEERGVFRTEDGGRTWARTLYIDRDTGCADMDLDLTNPRNVYAGMWTFRRRPWRFDDGGRNTAVHVSRDGGVTWRKVETLPDEPMARPGLSVAQSSPNVVYLLTEFPTAGTLFRSDDRGETWAMVNDDRDLNFRPFYYSDVYADPTDENTLYTLSGGLSKSTDGGRTFERIARDVHGDHQAYWIDPADGDRILSGSDGGHQVSVDGGENFHIWRNIVLSQFYHIFVDDRDPYWVCGGLQDNGNWCGPSRDRGDGIMPDEWYTVSGGDGFYTVPVPGKPWLVYSNAQGGYFRITDIRSGQTRSIEPYPRMMGSQGQSMAQARYRFNWDAPIVVSPHDPDVVYWGGNVLFRSDDQGYTWDVISPDLTTDDPEKQRDSGGEIYNDNTAAEFHTTIYTVAPSPVEPGVIWVGTDDGNVQLTRDGGSTWNNVRANIPGLPAEAWINHIEASGTDAGTALMVVDNHRMDDFRPYLWETTDYGRTWTNLSANIPLDDYAKLVREHPANPDLLFLGMDRGIFGSLDRGRTWFDLRLNLPRVSVRGITIEPRYDDLVIGTHGRGAWILDDVGPLVGLADAMSRPVHLFGVRTATDWESWDRDTNLGQSAYVGQNPEEGAYINYWLADAPAPVAEDAGSNGNGGGNGGGSTGNGEGDAAGRASGLDAAAPVTVRITDASGTLVRTLVDRDAGPGVNRLVWDLTWEGAEGADQGGGGWWGGSSGPPVVPGVYTATLVVDGRELSTDFRVRGDPGVEGVTQADYAARTEAALRARDLESRLNGMIGAIDDLDVQIDGLLEALEGKDLARAAEIRALAADAREQLGMLADEHLRRPPPDMGYRQYPRLSEEASRLGRSIRGVQARPTAGQLEALGDIEAEAAARADELRAILDGPVAELNDLLGGQPRLLVRWGEPRRISLREGR